MALPPEVQWFTACSLFDFLNRSSSWFVEQCDGFAPSFVYSWFNSVGAVTDDFNCGHVDRHRNEFRRTGHRC